MQIGTLRAEPSVAAPCLAGICMSAYGGRVTDAFAGFVTDASPVGSPPLDPSPYVAARLVLDTELPLLRGHLGPVVARLSGGAGQVAGPVGLASKLGLDLSALVVALRDLDDPAGNARRVVAAVDAARADGLLADDVAVHVRVDAEPTWSWLAAVDEVAAAELALTLPLTLGGAGVDAWVDAALDRELSFSLAGGTADDAVTALRTTARLWGDPDDLLAARRWSRSWATDDPATAVARMAGL